MYAWKCWRDTRFIFRIALTLELGLVAINLIVRTPPVTTSLPVHTWQVAEVLHWMFFQRFFIYLMAILSSAAIMSSFTLTRPIARRHMVWTALGVATAQFLLLFAIVGVSAAIQVSRSPRSFNLATTSLSVSSAILLLLAVYFLAAQIARSSLSLILLLISRRKGLYGVPLLSLAFAYLILAGLQPALFPHFMRWLPQIVPQVFVFHGDDVTMQPHLYLSLLLRCAFVLGLTFLTQKVLEKREAV